MVNVMVMVDDLLVDRRGRRRLGCLVAWGREKGQPSVRRSVSADVVQQTVIEVTMMRHQFLVHHRRRRRRRSRWLGSLGTCVPPEVSVHWAPALSVPAMNPP